MSSNTSSPFYLYIYFNRWEKDYNESNHFLVNQTLELLYSARRGLSENEILSILEEIHTVNNNNSGRDMARWNSFFSGLKEILQNSQGIYAFANESLRKVNIIG